MNLHRYMNHWVEIIYMDRFEVITQRTIMLLEMSGHLVTAYCLQKQKLRRFNSNNILAIRVVRPSQGLRPTKSAGKQRLQVESSTCRRKAESARKAAPARGKQHL
ncbi:hypothetical protein [Paenibacillus senegalensis]|uniref:hypothetical protein n=1 Tax=Paenibacillus senegalensis TaxID=1465766 RepID=UPI0002899FE5|nr:hypothetical protein [Paenibacillus senegalensis]